MQCKFHTRPLIVPLFLIITIASMKYILFKLEVNFFPFEGSEIKKNTKYKYILTWTSSETVPFVYLKSGREAFISRKCRHTNCIVTSDKKYFRDLKLFDVIAFHGPELNDMPPTKYPTERSQQQKFVFASIESPQNYPVCIPMLNNYFNWTWTYRLDSEVRWGYIVIRDSKNNIIGPNKNMNWIKWKDMRDVSSEIKDKLKRKTKAVAWFVSNCETANKREHYALSLRMKLRKYNLTTDVYGDCEELKCSRDKQDECNKMIENDYYFYLSFENSLTKDYVTEKLLIPLKNNAIPIVYGGADYTRFLPEKSYLDARKLGVKELASTINKIIKNPEEYASYFRWKNYYSYHTMPESPETDEYCKMCEILNNNELMTQKSVYTNFVEWWNDNNC